jgi:hypothetical protein
MPHPDETKDFNSTRIRIDGCKKSIRQHINRADLQVSATRRFRVSEKNNYLKAYMLYDGMHHISNTFAPRIFRDLSSISA